MEKTKQLIILIVFTLLFCNVRAQQTDRSHNLDAFPPIPVGLDAYRMWDMIPMQRIGVRAYMRSTYDRSGGNEGADASHFLFANEEDHNVTLDIKGKGILYFFRANHWHGGPWHFIVDAKDYIVKETGTDDPIHAVEKFKTTHFIPEGPFPVPLDWTWGITRGSDLIWTPMPFQKSFRIAYSRTHYGAGYYIYDLYANEDNLSKPIRSWSFDNIPDRDVLDLINKSGTDIAPENIKKKIANIKLDKERLTLLSIRSSSSVIRAVKLTLPMDKVMNLERVRLVITWDDSPYPSVDAPLCLFFGTGSFYNREKKEYLVRGFPINVRYDYANNKVELACYYPMPFFKSAKIELAGIKPDNTEIQYEIRYESYKIPAFLSSYFHATYQDMPHPLAGKDMSLLDTKGIEGHQEWSGSFVGMSIIFSHNGVLSTLEGDPRFYFDDSKTPQAYGAGTEDWCGGGDYWGGQNMTLPFAGHPVGCGENKQDINNEKDLIESAYRFLIADLMPFGQRAEIDLEHGGEDLSAEHYESVTYWYGLPAPSLIRTDSIDIGNLNSEKVHNYSSPEASDVESIESRYELGIDFIPNTPRNIKRMETGKLSGLKENIGKEVYPSHKEYGRYTRGTTEFTVQLDPDNLGVLLRRTLDYSFPNQTAEVYVSAVKKQDSNMKISAEDTLWEKAGIWYLAGSNTVLYSNPEGELEKRELVTETSNRRFRDDEFLIPARLTKNCVLIRIKIEFIPDDQELFPGFPFPKKSAWSELKYDVYSYIIPKFHL